MIAKSSNWTNFDPTEPIQGPIKFFKFVGIWPPNNKYKYRYLYIIYGILFQLIFSYIYTGLGVGNSTDVTNIKVMTEQIFVGLAEISMCLRMTNFVVNFKETKNFLNIIKSFKLRNQEEYALYKKKLSLFSPMMKFYLSCASFAVTFSCVAPLFDDEFRLPYPAWYPWDWSNFSNCFYLNFN